MGRNVIEFDDDYDFVVHKKKPKGNFLLALIMGFVMAILVIFGVGWYFNSSKEGKRRIWVALVIFIVLSLLWQNVFVDNLAGKIQTKDEMQELTDRMRSPDYYNED